MAANYNRTKPVDPLWYRRDRSIRVYCTCGHFVRINIADLIARGIDENTHLYQVHRRLTCSKCGKREARIDPT